MSPCVWVCDCLYLADLRWVTGCSGFRDSGTGRVAEIWEGDGPRPEKEVPVMGMDSVVLITSQRRMASQLLRRFPKDAIRRLPLPAVLL